MPGTKGATLEDAIATITEEARVVTSAEPPWVVLHTNKAWCEATGFSFLEMVGRTCDVLHGPRTCGPELLGLQSALERRTSPCSESLVLYRKHGEPFLGTLSFELVRGGSHWLGKLRATPVTDGSIAPAVRTPEELATKELVPVSYADHGGARKRARRSSSGADKVRLVEVVNNTTDPIVLCAAAPPHVITHPNQPWLEMCGYTLEEVEACTNKILTGAETDRAAIERLLGCVRRREPPTFIN